MRARIHKLWSTLVHEHTSAGRLALAVWLGVMIGCSPFFGLHWVIALALGFLLRLNKLVMYAAAQVSIPPLAPFLGYAAVHVGHRARSGGWHSFRLDHWRDQPLVDLAKTFFVDWLVGGALIGLVAGAVAAGVTYLALRLHGNTPLHRAISRAAYRYKSAPPKYAYYARIKYRMDPVYARIAAHVKERTQTVDLGAGLGMLGVLLAELGGDRKTHGIEWDAAKVAVGRSVAPGVKLERGDITELQTLPATDAVTLVDVLHYFDDVHIQRVLDVAASALRPGGKIFVREGDLDAGGGAGWTRLIERMAVSLGWNRAPAVRFLSKEKLTHLLQERGLRVEVEHASGPAHPGNLLFIGTK